MYTPAYLTHESHALLMLLPVLIERFIRYISDSYTLEGRDYLTHETHALMCTSHMSLMLPVYSDLLWWKRLGHISDP
jgi:hypothetical protein